MITVELKNQDQLEAHFKSIESNTPVQMRKAINAAALMVKSYAQNSINRQSAGKPYNRYQPTRTGLASKEGQAPNKDRGNLVDNILTSSGTGIKTKEYFALVRSQAPYSKDLEYGTENMKARPFMKPAIDANREKIKALVAKAIRGVL